MRALVQRVCKAKVSVGQEVVGEIGRGFVVLVGVTHGDTPAGAEWLANKVAGLRLFEDEQGKMNRALADVDGQLLVISQFTLYGDAGKGRRPSFIQAARPEQAEPLVNQFIAFLRGHGLRVATGRFGAEMVVEIHNNGPVTLMVENSS